jgi:hypothetical protein
MNINKILNDISTNISNNIIDNIKDKLSPSLVEELNKFLINNVFYEQIVLDDIKKINEQCILKPESIIFGESTYQSYVDFNNQPKFERKFENNEYPIICQKIKRGNEFNCDYGIYYDTNIINNLLLSYDEICVFKLIILHHYMNRDLQHYTFFGRFLYMTYSDILSETECKMIEELTKENSNFVKLTPNYNIIKDKIKQKLSDYFNQTRTYKLKSKEYDKLYNIQNELDNLMIKYNGLQDSLSNSELINNNLNDTISDLKNKNILAIETNTKNETKIKNIEDKLNKTNDYHNELNQKIELLNSTITSQLDIIESLNLSIVDYEQKNKLLTNKIDNLDIEIEKIDLTNQQLESNKQYLEFANQQLEFANQQLESTNQQLESTNQQLESTNQNLSNTIFKSNITINDLNIELDKCRSTSINYDNEKMKLQLSLTINENEKYKIINELNSLKLNMINTSNETNYWKLAFNILILLKLIFLLVIYLQKYSINLI